MEVKEIYVEMAATHTVNYHSFRKQVGLRADLDDGEDAKECVRELQRRTKKMLLPNFEQAGNQNGQ